MISIFMGLEELNDWFTCWKSLKLVNGMAKLLIFDKLFFKGLNHLMCQSKKPCINYEKLVKSGFKRDVESCTFPLCLRSPWKISREAIFSFRKFWREFETFNIFNFLIFFQFHQNNSPFKHLQKANFLLEPQLNFPLLI